MRAVAAASETGAAAGGRGWRGARRGARRGGVPGGGGARDMVARVTVSSASAPSGGCAGELHGRAARAASCSDGTGRAAVGQGESVGPVRGVRAAGAVRWDCSADGGARAGPHVGEGRAALDPSLGPHFAAL